MPKDASTDRTETTQTSQQSTPIDQAEYAETATQPQLRTFRTTARRFSVRKVSRRGWALIVSGVALVAVLVSGIGVGVYSLTRPTPRSIYSAPTWTPVATMAANPNWRYNPSTDNSTAQLLANEHQADIAATAQYYLDKMTLDEKLGQMFLIETYYQTWTPDIANMVVGMHAGATIIYAKNMQSKEQLQSYIASMQAHAQIPMLVTMDEEGGLVDRLGSTPNFFPLLPSAQWLGSSGNPALATQYGNQAAQEMQQMGINTDLAPVVDVAGPGSIETTRLYGSDPSTVDTYAGAYLNALQNNGIVGTLKHWPGIGNSTTDPHLALPTITDSMAQLESNHFAPFKALLADNPGMIMVTHVLVNAIDPNMPATLSPKMVDGVLRGQLGYNGVVMTDSLYMQGIAVKYNLAQAGVLAIIAGDDLLEGAFDTSSMQDMIAAIKAAMSSGQITTGRIDQSVMRILELKIRFGMLPLLPLRNNHVTPGAGSAPFAGALQADFRRNTAARSSAI